MRLSKLHHKSFRLALLAGVLLTLPSLVHAQAAKDPKTDRLWRAKCASCHGEDGKGQTEQGKKMGTGDLTLAAWQKANSDEQISKAILDGLKREKAGKQQEMEPFKDKLKPEQVQALVTYVRGFGK